MSRVPIFIQARRSVFIGLNDHTPRRMDDLAAAGGAVTLFCPRVPMSLLPRIVDGRIRHSSQMPAAEDLRGADAVFIQTGDPATDLVWRAKAEQLGLPLILVESQRPERSQPLRLRLGRVWLWLPHPITALRSRVWPFVRRSDSAEAKATSGPLP